MKDEYRQKLKEAHKIITDVLSAMNSEYSSLKEGSDAQEELSIDISCVQDIRETLEVMI